MLCSSSYSEKEAKKKGSLKKKVKTVSDHLIQSLKIVDEETRKKIVTRLRFPEPVAGSFQVYPPNSCSLPRQTPRETIWVPSPGPLVLLAAIWANP